MHVCCFFLCQSLTSTEFVWRCARVCSAVPFARAHLFALFIHRDNFRVLWIFSDFYPKETKKKYENDKHTHTIFNQWPSMANNQQYCSIHKGFCLFFFYEVIWRFHFSNFLIVSQIHKTAKTTMRIEKQKKNKHWTMENMRCWKRNRLFYCLFFTRSHHLHSLIGYCLN